MKRSTIAGLTAAVILIIVPAVFMSLNIAPVAKARAEAAQALRLAELGEIHVVEIVGPNARRTMMSADKGRRPYVMLRTVPDSVVMRGDTLCIALGDGSALYQGTLRLPGLRTVIYRQRAAK